MSVFIIPGFFRRKKFYQPLLERLQQAGLPAEIIDLSLNVREIKHSAQIVSRYLKKTEEKDDIIAHSFGGLILKRILVSDPEIAALIKSISFVAVPHQGSWAALLVPVWPQL
jgi:triacylglycerol esterase/lipase EstA (alpha/beta hydrolase family)